MQKLYAASEVVLTSNSDRIFRANSRFHIFVVVGGSCMVSWGAQMRLCGPDSLVLMQPGHQLAMRPCGGKAGARVVWLRLESEALRVLSDEDTDLLHSFSFIPFGCACVPADSSASMLAGHVATRLCLATARTDFGNGIYLRGLLSIFLVLTLRICIAADFQSPKAQRPLFLPDRVFSFIREHLGEPMPLKRLADELFVSHEYLSRAFKKQTGQTVHRYILQQRLEWSCRLLRQDVPVVEVWRRCGFNSYSYFFQVFKRHYGVTPKSLARREPD